MSLVYAIGLTIRFSCQTETESIIFSQTDTESIRFPETEIEPNRIVKTSTRDLSKKKEALNFKNWEKMQNQRRIRTLDLAGCVPASNHYTKNLFLAVKIKLNEVVPPIFFSMPAYRFLSVYRFGFEKNRLKPVLKNAKPKPILSIRFGSVSVSPNR